MRYLVFFSLLFSTLLHGQVNIDLLGSLDIQDTHSTVLNDIWGYVDENNNEYAIVGCNDGVSIVDVTDPVNPVEIFWVDGLNSIWRDIKTYGDYAYITTEADQGLMIIDLSPLPASTSLNVTTYSGPTGNEWLSAHNLFEDNGYLYIFGAGRGNGGVIILDVATDPLNPLEVGEFDNWYVHDGVVLNDTAYFAHIYEGNFSIVDVTNKNAPVLLGTAMTPTNFAHNIWYSEDGNSIFTTDEVSGGYIGSFDVSNAASPVFLDQIQSSPGDGIVPHNCHTIGNYLVTSYYADGVVVHDVTHPHNMVEVANYDTSPLNDPTTVGCWGAYPYLPSGIVLASDRQEGLFILDVNYTQGCYLEGNVTEQGTGFNLNNVEVSIDGTLIQDYSNIMGDYATGIADAGSYDVEYFKVLYYPQTINVSMSNGVISTQDVQLQKIPQFSVTIRVLDAQTLAPIENAQVLLQHTFIDHNGLTDVNGEAVIDMYYQDNYQLFAGKWGYHTGCFVDTLINNGTGTIEVMIDKGIYDDFVFDHGWTSTGSAARGFWEREIPVGVESPSGVIENPYNDAQFDCGEYAFITGNGTTSLNTEEVNDGEVVLMSPIFDLTPYATPYINYTTWFFNKYGALAPDDTLKVYIFNGTDLVLLEERHIGNSNISEWQTSSIPVDGLITFNTTMQMVITLGDEVTSENVTEGGFDHFSVTEFSTSSVEEEDKNEISIYPNPFTDVINITGINDGQLQVFDLSGRIVFNAPVSNQMEISGLEKGVYLFVLSDINSNIVKVDKQIKE